MCFLQRSQRCQKDQLFTHPHTRLLPTGSWNSRRRGTHLPMWYHSLAINKVLNHIFACWHRVSLSEELPPRKSPITLLWASENRLQKWVSVCMLYQVPNSLFPNLIDQLNREKLRTADGPLPSAAKSSIFDDDDNDEVSVWPSIRKSVARMIPKRELTFWGS